MCIFPNSLRGQFSVGGSVNQLHPFNSCIRRRTILDRKTRAKPGSQIQTNSLFSTNHPRGLKKDLILIGETWMGVQGRKYRRRRDRGRQPRFRRWSGHQGDRGSARRERRRKNSETSEQKRVSGPGRKKTSTKSQ